MSEILVADLLDRNPQEVERLYEMVGEKILNDTLIGTRPGRDMWPILPTLSYFSNAGLTSGRETASRENVFARYISLLRQSDTLLSRMDVTPWLDVRVGPGEWISLSNDLVFTGDHRQRPLYVDRKRGEIGTLAEDFSHLIHANKVPDDHLERMISAIHQDKARSKAVPEFITGLAAPSVGSYAISRYSHNAERYRVIHRIVGNASGRLMSDAVWQEQLDPADIVAQVREEPFDVAGDPPRALLLDARLPGRLLVTRENWSVERVLAFGTLGKEGLSSRRDQPPVTRHSDPPGEPSPAERVVDVAWPVKRIARASWVMPGEQVFVLEEGLKRGAIVTLDGELICTFPGRETPPDRLYLALGPGYVVTYAPASRRVVLMDLSHRDMGAVDIAMDATSDRVAVAGRDVLAIFHASSNRILFCRLSHSGLRLIAEEQ